MQTKHTPGPWAYDADSQEVFSDDAQHGAGWIAFIKGNDCDGRPLTEPERLANARLIAAAPDLLAALRELMQGVYDEFSSSHPLHEAADRARSVINRATGA